MTTVDVACFGELLWDFFEAEARTNKEPVARLFRRELGGASANVAVVLARLGVSVSAVGGVGKDKLGAALKASLVAEGVDAGHVASLDAPTGITFVTGEAARPSFSPYRIATADMAFGAEHVTPAMAKVRWAVVSSTSMLPALRAGTEKFLAALDKAKGHLFVDLNARAHLWSDVGPLKEACAELARRAAVVKASEADLEALAGKRGVSWLEQNAKHATWVLTRGENGAAAVGTHGQATAKTKRVRVVDATGAGDAFTAGVVAVLLGAGTKPSSASWKDPKLWTRAMEMGHQLGAKAVTALGATAGVVSLDDLRARLA